MICWESAPRRGYNWHAETFEQEDFTSGIATNGQMGKLGWLFAAGTGGTVSFLAAEANHPGIVRLDTGLTSGTRSRMGLNGNTISSVLLDRLRFGFLFRLNNTDTDTISRIGFMADANGNPTSNGFYIEKLAADANWFRVAREAGTQTRADTSVAVDTDWHFAEFDLGGGVATFYLDGVSLGSISDANVPAGVGGFPAAQIINNTTASKTIDIDYYEHRIYVSR